MADIFISYRRADSAGVVGRLYDRLVAAFGADRVFKDVEDILGGRNFTEVLRQTVTNAKVVLVVIGDRWTTLTGPDGGRRLDDEDDLVREEARLALDTPGVIVIPVLVNNAALPSAADLPADIVALRARNSLPVRNDPDFDTDVMRLITQIRAQVPALNRVSRPRRRMQWRQWVVPTLLMLGVLFGVVYFADPLGLGRVPGLAALNNLLRGPDALAVGEVVAVVVADDSLTGLRLRTGPGLTFPEIVTLAPGTRMVLLAGPLDDQNIRWWRARRFDNVNTAGWLAEGPAEGQPGARYIQRIEG